MTNYEFLLRFSQEEFARFLTYIKEESKTETEWLEWLNALINIQQWDEIFDI